MDSFCRFLYNVILAVVVFLRIIKNGLLSFENPNYHLDPARLDDALNSNGNGSSLYDELYQELVGSGGQGGEVTGGGGGGGGTRVQARRTYATLDLGSMGVDVTQGPLTQDSVTDDASDNTDNHNLGYGCEGVAESALVDDTLNGNPHSSTSSSSSAILPQSHALQSGSAGSIDATDTSESRNYCEKPDNETAEMGGVPHVEGGLNSELYAVPVKRRQPKEQKNNAILQNNTQEKPTDVDSVDSEDKDENLPPGWQKHEDENGPYYWHVKSGNIQREPPEAPLHAKTEARRSLVKDNDSINNFHTLSGMVNTVTRSNTSSALDQELENKRKVELALKRRSYPARADSEGRDKPIRFAVRSLGWTEIAEEDLTPERSSKAVNKCIVDLSLGRNDLLDVVGRWGDGKDLFMDLDEGALKLIDPENLTVLNTQPIHTVRVWGVGRDHCRERDFAYVARDRSTRKHMCHVFRCDIPARTIANTLRDICKKIMIERSQHQNLAKPVDINGRTSLATRPTNLPTEHRRFHRNGQTLVTQSFPTPMEEPKKVLRAQYLGSMQVTQATGMEVLNEAIEHIVTNTPINQWRNVNVAVAPSMISIHTPNDDKLITECRVRYLSFLGIGHNVKQCAFIMHTAQDLFIAHIFNCEPSSGALCKTIEAACKLRYQKCLDAHPQGFRNASSLNTPSGRGLGATIKSLVGSLTGRRNKQGES
nr:PREDICTED: amyloid beta A4 precursor protein-binding family B member 2-like isoform X1 [Linepithema humile]XP_012218961.1 PREDICTED: amyloid beta A4 precursor protein-binding family B member 2-like isoform X1 [Linepithema humile]